MKAAQLPISRRLVENQIRKTAKRVMTGSGMNSATRRGNKELNHLVRRVAQQPISSLEQASQIGETLGQSIVTLSNQLGRTSLDQGIIRQLVVQDAQFSVKRGDPSTFSASPVAPNLAEGEGAIAAQSAVETSAEAAKSSVAPPATSSVISAVAAPEDLEPEAETTEAETTEAESVKPEPTEADESKELEVEDVALDVVAATPDEVADDTDEVSELDPPELEDDTPDADASEALEAAEAIAPLDDSDDDSDALAESDQSGALDQEPLDQEPDEERVAIAAEETH